MKRSGDEGSGRDIIGSGSQAIEVLSEPEPLTLQTDPLPSSNSNAEEPEKRIKLIKGPTGRWLKCTGNLHPKTTTTLDSTQNSSVDTSKKYRSDAQFTLATVVQWNCSDEQDKKLTEEIKNEESARRGEMEKLKDVKAPGRQYSASQPERTYGPRQLRPTPRKDRKDHRAVKSGDNSSGEEEPKEQTIIKECTNTKKRPPEKYRQRDDCAAPPFKKRNVEDMYVHALGVTQQTVPPPPSYIQQLNTGNPNARRETAERLERILHGPFRSRPGPRDEDITKETPNWTQPPTHLNFSSPSLATPHLIPTPPPPTLLGLQRDKGVKKPEGSKLDAPSEPDPGELYNPESKESTGSPQRELFPPSPLSTQSQEAPSNLLATQPQEPKRLDTSTPTVVALFNDRQAFMQLQQIQLEQRKLQEQLEILKHHTPSQSISFGVAPPESPSFRNSVAALGSMIDLTLPGSPKQIFPQALPSPASNQLPMLFAQNATQQVVGPHFTPTQPKQSNTQYPKAQIKLAPPTTDNFLLGNWSYYTPYQQPVTISAIRINESFLLLEEITGKFVAVAWTTLQGSSVLDDNSFQLIIRDDTMRKVSSSFLVAKTETGPTRPELLLFASYLDFCKRYFAFSSLTVSISNT